MKTRPAGIGNANADWMGSLPSKLSAMPLKQLAVPGEGPASTAASSLCLCFALARCLCALVHAPCNTSSRLARLFHLLGGRERSGGPRPEVLREIPGHHVQCGGQEGDGEVVHDPGSDFTPSHCFVFSLCISTQHYIFICRIYLSKSSSTQESATLTSGSPPNPGSLDARSTSSMACLATM